MKTQKSKKIQNPEGEQEQEQTQKIIFQSHSLSSSHFQSFSLSPTLSRLFLSPRKFLLSFNIGFWTSDQRGTNQHGGFG